MEETGESGFYRLPEGVIADVVSLTTPHDACQLSLVAKLFTSAAESEVVWEKFQPSDYRSIIATSIDPSAVPNFASTKQLYLHLCDHPLIIDGGNKSFSLEKKSGKKCFMLAAVRSLSFRPDDFWGWTSVPDARKNNLRPNKNRFEATQDMWFDINGTISTRLLSPDTNYAAYLVYKFTDNTCRYEYPNYGNQISPPKAFFGMANGDDNKVRFVVLEPKSLRQRYDVGGVSSKLCRDDMINPKGRKDGWVEVELGEFYNNNSEQDLELKMGLQGEGTSEHGFIFLGIEIRP